MSRKIGIQLFTVRESLSKDFAGVVTKIAKMGYAGIESAGNFGGMSPKEVRAFLDGLNLKLFSGHLRLEAFDDKFDQLCADYAAMGAKYLALAWLAPEKRTAEGYTEAAHALTKCAPIAAKHGITLCYHNHDFEFAKLPDGRTGYDILMTHMPPEVKFELDVYWVTFAGLDPITQIGKMKGRLPLLHTKDMEAETRTFASVGEGTLDFKNIMAAADAAGVDWFVVEQDKTPKGELESAATSINNIKAKGWA